jgi:hypothetical protein
VEITKLEKKIPQSLSKSKTREYHYVKIVTTHRLPSTIPHPQHTHTLESKYLTTSHNTLTQEYKRKTKKWDISLKMFPTGGSSDGELCSIFIEI